MGARLLTDEETGRAGRATRSPTRAGCSSTSLGQSCVEPRRRWPASRSADTDKVLLAPLPADLDALAAHPFIAEKLMPVLGRRALAVGRARDRGLRAGHRARRPGPHVGRVRDRRCRDRPLLAGDPHRADPRQRADRGRGAGRRLQLDDADVLARLRHLGRLEHNRQRQLPEPARTSRPSRAARRRRSGSACPSDTYFNPGALENLRLLDALPADDRHRRADRGARGRPRTSAIPHRRRRARVLRRSSPSRPRQQIRAGVEQLEQRRRRRDHRGRRRLGDGRRQGDAAVPREPAARASASSRCRSSMRASGSRTSPRSITSCG